MEQGGAGADALEVVGDERVGGSDGEVRYDGSEGVCVVRPGCCECYGVLNGVYDPRGCEHVSDGD